MHADDESEGFRLKKSKLTAIPTCNRRPPLQYAAYTGLRFSAPTDIRGSNLSAPTLILLQTSQNYIP